MGWLMDVLGSAGFGSIIGVVGGYLTKREERENMKMKFNHDLNMLKARTDATIEVAKMGIEEAKIAGTLVVEKIEAKAFEVSQKSTSKFADTLKAIVRPVILFLLMFQTYRILQTLEIMTGGIQSFDMSEVLDLYKIIVLAITGLTATAVSWFFSARSSKQFDRLLDKWHK